MQIEIGKAYENKTSRFLVPCLRAYGEDFVIKLNPTLRVAIGIHDYVSGDLITDRTIYMLFDTFHNTKAFSEFYEWVKRQEFFVKDYQITNFITGNLMIVLKIPENYWDAYDNFLLGNYTKMYSQEDLINLFGISTRHVEYDILNLEQTAKTEFIKKLNQEFGTSISEFSEDVKEIELPPIMIEEVFNCPATFGKSFISKEMLIN